LVTNSPPPGCPNSLEDALVAGKGLGRRSPSRRRQGRKISSEEIRRRVSRKFLFERRERFEKRNTEGRDEPEGRAFSGSGTAAVDEPSSSRTTILIGFGHQIYYD